MKAEEIRKLTEQELVERIEAERLRLQELRMSHAVTPLENAMQLRDVKRTIARLLTVQTEREIASRQGHKEN